MKKEIAIIGSGFSGLTSAALLAKEGYQVSVYEKNTQIGGRARQFSEKGFTFDMGPSWYWMPEVFENLYQQFNHTTSDFYDLVELSPAFNIYFGKDDLVKIPSEKDDLFKLFAQLEHNGDKKLEKFLDEAEKKYAIGISDLVYKPSKSPLEFMDFNLLKNLTKYSVFGSFDKHVRSFFSNTKIHSILEFPILFLGALPQNTPALYSLMNHAELSLGTWYPMGGFYKIVQALESICKENGVSIKTNANVKSIKINRRLAHDLEIDNLGLVNADAVIASADYHHVDQHLIPKEFSSYTPNYWNSRILAPSSLIFYLGINKKLEGMEHHNLFFDEDLTHHGKEIYTTPTWPTKPLFYACCPSKTDPDVAPDGHENLFLLMPLAPGLEDSEEKRKQYFNIMLERLKQITGNDIANHIIYKKSYAIKDFTNDYNALKGNAYGLANTLKQTAFFKPSIRSKKIKNLFYTGQLTVPGPGVPPALISGEVAAKEVIKYLKQPTHERII